MPPPRRSRRRRLQRSAEAPRASGGNGWLSVRRGQFKRQDERHGDDGLPISDEALLLVFSGLSGSTVDLARCAASCRRWLRLVSADAAFICREPPRSDRFIRRLALGFFLNNVSGGGAGSPSAPPRFVPMELGASSSLGQQLSLSTLVGDDGVLDSSRVVASRNGRLVLDLRRGKGVGGHVLRLCVCNPMTGDVDFLPPLRRKDSPGPYACTVLTAIDEPRGTDTTTTTTSSYRVLLVYNRRSFTALRCYDSSEGGWGPEAQVTGARIGRKRLGMSRRSVQPPPVMRRGVVFWPGLDFDLLLSTLQPSAAKDDASKLPYAVIAYSSARRRRGYRSNADRLVGLMPDGRLCVIEADSETIRAYYTSCPGYGAIGNCLSSSTKEWCWAIKVALIGPPEYGVHTVKLRWFFENSGVVLFTARNGHTDPNTYVYKLDVETKQVVRVAGGDGESIGEIYGYEMDRVALLASLAR
ncbi:uncharacterized protein LOC104583061 [Brachypodium distachyon]|uniref:F-box domain-containing protein n=1 Tax=Brachypodium distachyon TaxID=15368 RepID=I1HEL9_BRADI|nr:uncharacterized protein LOC104583061 [Brachypodium distachyon]XP_024315387.1 uncharacterized protein LOC104583061 [Brachypodium distachyon]KQK03966.1 hypothetical protein BRADI_2g10900v3 [Brachypodium distachyon]|eukprot:XP_010233059.1 uncharacterized protein LOC104583061 [Brachypodium distachyon]